MGKPNILFDRAVDALRHIPGVVGIGTGVRFAFNGRSRVPVLRVIVTKKRPLFDVPPRERIPRFFEGIAVDVCERLPAVLAADKLVPLGGGLEVGTKQGSQGTLGCFAKSGNVTVLLTAGHVVQDAPGNIPGGADIGSPQVESSCCCKTGVIGEVLKGLVNGSVDCAVATLNGKRPFLQTIFGLGPDKHNLNTDQIVGVAEQKPDPVTGKLVSVQVHDHVRKVGVTTGKTGGVVNSIDFSIPETSDATGTLPPMQHQFIIEPLQKEGRLRKDKKIVDFTEVGDSGAMLMDDDNRVCGMVVRSVDFTGQPNVPDWMGNGGGVTDIKAILDALNITIFPSTTSGASLTYALRPGMAVHRIPALPPELQVARDVIETVKGVLSGFPLGERFVDFVFRHEPEILRLVNHDRRVTVAWQRAKGPAFLALLLRDFHDMDAKIPRFPESEPSLEAGLASVCAALETRGSPDLVAEMAPLWPILKSVLPASHTVRGLVENLRAVECHV